LWYHWLNGNKIHVLKTIKSKLIRTQVEIPNICTFEILFLTMNETQQCYGYMKIQIKLKHSKVHRKVLAMIIEEFFRLKFYYLIIVLMLNHYR
jgi:hypothetical protein